MVPRPRSNPAFAALLWIALAIGGLAATPQAFAGAGDYGTAGFETAPDPWHAVVPAEELLADTEDEASGDSLPPALRRDVLENAFRSFTGRDWFGSPLRFLIPFETGPPVA